MKRVFADTGFLYYLVDTRRKNKERSELANIFEQMCVSDGVVLVLTDYIFDEVITRVRMDIGWREALKIGMRILSFPHFIIEEISSDIFTIAWNDYFIKYKDKEFSFTDCTSFAAMETLGIRRVTTNDKDFERVTKGFVVEYI